MGDDDSSGSSLDDLQRIELEASRKLRQNRLVTVSCITTNVLLFCKNSWYYRCSRTEESHSFHNRYVFSTVYINI